MPATSRFNQDLRVFPVWRLYGCYFGKSPEGSRIESRNRDGGFSLTIPCGRAS